MPLVAAFWAAPAVTWIVSVPSLLGEPRETVNVYGPAPLPEEAPFVQFVEVPPIVTSVVVESKPVTDSSKLAEQLKLVLLDGLAVGVQDRDAVGGERTFTSGLVAIAAQGPALLSAVLVAKV